MVDPTVLFVPAGGGPGEGGGECTRVLILAAGIVRRHPRAQIRIVSDARFPPPPYDRFERCPIRGKVSKNPHAFRDLLRGLAPDLVLFDNTGGSDQIRFAHQTGARTVYLSSLPQTRRRVFRLRRLRSLDQVWLVDRHFTPGGQELRTGERVKRSLSRRIAVCFLDPIFPAPDPQRRRELRTRLGLGRDPYVLFVSGGGGLSQRGRPVAEVFLEAARLAQRRTDRRCVAVMGPLYAGTRREADDVTVVPFLPPAELIDLLSGASLVACGGGGILMQALALKRMCVVAPAGPFDQAERANSCAAEGLIELSPLDADEIGARIARLATDAGHAGRLRARVEELELGNGLAPALRQLERLLESGRTRALPRSERAARAGAASAGGCAR